MNRRAIFGVFLGLFVSCFLSGCADPNKVYDFASRFEVTDEQLEVLSEGKAKLVYDKGEFESTYDYMRYVAATYVSAGSMKIKEHAVGIIIFCIVFGLILHYFSGISATLKVWSWVIGLGGSVLVFVSVWGSALLADWFG